MVAAGVQRVTLASDDPAVVALQIIDDWDETNRAAVNPIVGQAGIAAGAGIVGVTVPRVTLASDDPAVAALQIMDDWDDNYRAAVNTIAGQVGVAGGSGIVSVLTQRVVLATDVALPAGTNAIGKLSANTGIDIGDVGVLSIAAGDNNIGNVDVVTLPNVTLAAGTNTNEVVGDAAHDAVIAGNPVAIGVRANANEPATPVADGDATHLWADLLGRLVVLTGHPSPEAPVTANGSASGLSVIATPGASLSLHICKVCITNRAAAENVVSLRDGAAGTIRTTINCAADGGGANLDYGARGWKLTANTALVADIASASADINVLEYYIAA